MTAVLVGYPLLALTWAALACWLIFTRHGGGGS